MKTRLDQTGKGELSFIGHSALSRKRFLIFRGGIHQLLLIVGPFVQKSQHHLSGKTFILSRFLLISPAPLLSAQQRPATGSGPQFFHLPVLNTRDCLRVCGKTISFARNVKAESESPHIAIATFQTLSASYHYCDASLCNESLCFGSLCFGSLCFESLCFELFCDNSSSACDTHG